jgi:hypothetical protein
MECQSVFLVIISHNLFPLEQHGFHPGFNHIQYDVEKVALGQVSVPTLIPLAAPHLCIFRYGTISSGVANSTSIFTALKYVLSCWQ